MNEYIEYKIQSVYNIEIEPILKLWLELNIELAIQFGSVPQNFDGVFNRPFLSAFTAHQLCRIYLPRATTSAQSTVRLRIYIYKL